RPLPKERARSHIRSETNTFSHLVSEPTSRDSRSTTNCDRRLAYCVCDMCSRLSPHPQRQTLSLSFLPYLLCPRHVPEPRHARGVLCRLPPPRRAPGVVPPPDPSPAATAPTTARRSDRHNRRSYWEQSSSHRDTRNR